MLFYLHVCLQAIGHLFQELRKTAQTFKVVAVDAFNLAREHNQPRKLLPVNLMIAFDDVGDDAAGVIGRRPVFVEARRSCRIACDGV